jgi:hypothetical protein
MDFDFVDPAEARFLEYRLIEDFAEMVIQRC